MKQAVSEALGLWVRPDERCVALTQSYWFLQKRKGHAYSIDDLLVAHWAGLFGGEPKRVLDLGCGFGSVLLMLAWARPQASFVGVEAQSESVCVASRNVLLNECQKRVELHHGDLRDRALLQSLGEFDLVTGTPPYFDPKAATPCADPQRAYAHFELRGGIEHYAQAASQVLSAEGRFVVCAVSFPPERTVKAMREAGLHIERQRSVISREGRGAFLDLLVARKKPVERVIYEPPLVLRHGDGRRTQEHIAVRHWFGVPCTEN